MEYVNYHKHSCYSNIRTPDSAEKIIDYINRAKELGSNIYSTVEHGFQGNIFETITLCEENNMHYIYGAEMYYVPSYEENSEGKKDRSNNHIVVIAKNNEGFKEINKALSIANIDGFYHKPRINDDILFNLFNYGNVIITTACVAGISARKDGEELIKKLKDKFKEDLFLEVQSHNHSAQIIHNKKVLRLSEKYNIELIHANDSHYIDEEGKTYRDIFLKGKEIFYGDEDSFQLDYPSSDEILKRYEVQGILSKEQAIKSLKNTLVFKQCIDVANIDKKIKLPKVSENPTIELKNIINNEFRNKGFNKLPKEKRQLMLDAVRTEMKTITDTKMENYFILDYKICKLAQEKYGGLLTKTGRGSAVSFLINHLLGLTEINRIESPVTLYPSRFMSAERILSANSLPDIDLNTSSQSEFIKATEEIIGKENCAWMLSYKPLQEKSAFRLYCKGIGLNISEYNSISKDLDLYREDSKWKDIIEKSKKFIGVIESISPSPCFVKGTMIYTKEGYKEIQDIKVGDYVLTHKNRFEKVSQIMKNESEDILKIKVMGSEEIFATSSHPFYVRTKEKGRKYTKNSEGKYTSVRNFSDAYWKNASNLQKGDFIAQPVNQKSEIPEFSIEKYKNKFTKEIERLDLSNENLWWIIGRYIGDGWCRKQVDKNGYIQGYTIYICCDKNEEKNEKEEIEKRLNGLFNYHIQEDKHTYRIVISSKILYEYLSKFGKYAHGKFIPNEVIDLPINLLKSFLEGYISADGYENQRKKAIYCTSVSKKLILGLQQCIHKVYKKPTTLVKTKPSKSYIDGREIVGKNDVYILSFIKNPRCTTGFYENGYMWLPFRKKEEQLRKENVYNFSVENDESYTVNNIAVHNCSMLVYDHNVSEEIGLIKTTDKICCLLDGYNCDKYKYLKNDILKVEVWSLIRNVCNRANIPIPNINELEEKLDKETWDIYANGITCTINQADSDFATGLVKEYKPTSVAEMSAFVASIRPGFASLLDNFIKRKPYTTKVKELDELLEDSFHYLMYQESIMKYLIWLGIDESETYTILKKIAKKKFKAEELEELHSVLISNWIEKINSIDNFEETWQVVEDASRYSFNASHSLSYAYDSLYGAYLKSHYPFEYYAEAFNMYSDDMPRTVKLTKELEYFNIRLNNPSFENAEYVYSFDKEKRIIYKGMNSIKYLNEKCCGKIAELSKNKPKTFIELLEELKGYANSRQIDILIGLGFFEYYGKSQKLRDIVKLYDKVYCKKQFKKDKITDYENVFRKYSKTETEKMFKDIDRDRLCDELISTYVKDINISSREQVQYYFEYIGNCNLKFNNFDKWDCVLVEKPIRYKRYSKIKLYNLKMGISQEFKISNDILDFNGINIYDLINVKYIEKKPKSKKVGEKWIKDYNDLDFWLLDYEIKEKSNV